MKNQAFRMTMLFDFYGEILTDRQKEFYDLYYNEDLSLAEIAENYGITRQGVRDVIVRAEAILTELEDKTGLIRRFHAMRSQLEDIVSAADGILVPVQCEYYALEGLSDLMSTLRAVKRRMNPRLEIFGVALTMFDGRTNFSNQVAEEVRRHFPGKVFGTVVPRNVRLAEAPSHGLPVTAYDKSSRGAKAYAALAEEVKAKIN